MSWWNAQSASDGNGKLVLFKPKRWKKASVMLFLPSPSTLSQRPWACKRGKTGSVISMPEPERITDCMWSCEESGRRGRSLFGLAPIYSFGLIAQYTISVLSTGVISKYHFILSAWKSPAGFWGDVIDSQPTWNTCLYVSLHIYKQVVLLSSTSNSCINPQSQLLRYGFSAFGNLAWHLCKNQLCTRSVRSSPSS